MNNARSSGLDLPVCRNVGVGASRTVEDVRSIRRGEVVQVIINYRFLEGWSGEGVGEAATGVEDVRRYLWLLNLGRWVSHLSMIICLEDVLRFQRPQQWLPQM